MIPLLKSKHRSLLGIDISSTSVKILEISSASQPYHVKAYGRAALPEGAVEGNVVKDVDEVAAVIRKMVATHHFTTKQVALAVPDSAVINKIIQINEGMSDADIEEFVVAESEKYIPYPIDEVNIDFEILGPSAKSGSMLDLLIVASRAENVNSRVEAVTRAGLEAQIMDIESYALERAISLLAPELPATGQNKTIAVFDIGAVYTNLYVLHDMKIIFSREEEFGGKQLVELIAEHYSMSMKDAELARAKGALPPEYQQEVWGPFTEMVMLQIKRALQFFFSTSHHTFVDAILLAGGIAKQEGLVDLVQQQLNIPSRLVNPFVSMTLDRLVNRDILYKDAPTLLIACGLALRRAG